MKTETELEDEIALFQNEKNLKSKQDLELAEIYLEGIFQGITPERYKTLELTLKGWDKGFTERNKYFRECFLKKQNKNNFEVQGELPLTLTPEQIPIFYSYFCYWVSWTESFKDNVAYYFGTTRTEIVFKHNHKRYSVKKNDKENLDNFFAFVDETLKNEPRNVFANIKNFREALQKGNAFDEQSSGDWLELLQKTPYFNSHVINDEKNLEFRPIDSEGEVYSYRTNSFEIKDLKFFILVVNYNLLLLGKGLPLWENILHTKDYDKDLELVFSNFKEKELLSVTLVVMKWLSSPMFSFFGTEGFVLSPKRTFFELKIKTFLKDKFAYKIYVSEPKKENKDLYEFRLGLLLVLSLFKKYERYFYGLIKDDLSFYGIELEPKKELTWKANERILDLLKVKNEKQNSYPVLTILKRQLGI